MAAHLRADRPLWTLRAPGLFAAEKHPTTRAALLDQWMVDIRRIQPHGPYTLAGYSLGCGLAWDLALRLMEQGHAVMPLLMIDGAAAPLASVPHHPPNHPDESTSTPPADPPLPEGADADPVALLKTQWAIRDAMQQIHEQWQPRAAALSVALLMCQDSQEQGTQPLLGWPALAQLGTHGSVVPGDHEGLAGAERAADLAAWMDDQLRCE
jgi:pimeloyl-ACP methyl ester carboxylesterase